MSDRDATSVEPCDLSIQDARTALGRRDLSAEELARSVLERIDWLEGTVNAFITRIPSSRVLEDARDRDRRAAPGEDRGLLHGIPIGLKDNFLTAGVRTTAGSRQLRDWVPEEDADAVVRLREAGSVLVGKLNMYEWAHSATDNPHTGRIPNPWDASRVTGGSSSGSAAALAAGMCLGATGNDAGGSIRIPSSFCGVVGLKATFGLVSRRGVLPTSPSLDHSGPMARTVGDIAVLLQVMAGHDPGDPTSVRTPGCDYLGGLERGVEGLVVGVERRFFLRYMDPSARRNFDRAVEVMASLGAEVEEIDLPSIEPTLWALVTIVYPESTLIHLEELEQRPGDYGDAIRASLIKGKETRAIDYLEALRKRETMRREVSGVLRKVDVLAGPTMPIEAPVFGTTVFSLEGNEYGLKDVYLRCVGTYNLTGHPAISIPFGYGEHGMPLGVQLAAAHFEEATLLRAARALEAAFESERRAPPLDRLDAGHLPTPE